MEKDGKLEDSKMEEPEPQTIDLEIELKYFEVGDGYSCVQLSTQMSGQAYSQLTHVEGQSSEEEKERKRKTKAIILCLDKSGSMSGAAYEALKEGALVVAQ